jgi:AcrR family transcriptional regulator
MEKSFTGVGDPGRGLDLLWGRQEPGRRGPKQRFSTEAVVQAAITLADEVGVDGLSMRKVAEAVGVSPMSLYTYVPSKAELIDLMFDRVLAEAPDPDPSMSGWRERLAYIAWMRWRLTERHPWLLDIAMRRPPIGPNVLRKVEIMIDALAGMGLEPAEIALTAEALQHYITGALQAAREDRELERASGRTEEEWMAQAEAAFAEHPEAVGPGSRERIDMVRRKIFPLHVDVADRFAFGLERLLDGVEAHIAVRRGGA